MTSKQKEAAAEKLRQEAKDFQARIGYLTLQVKSARKEMEALERLLEYGEVEFRQLKDAPIDADEVR